MESAGMVRGGRVVRIGLANVTLGLGGTAPNNLVKVTNGSGFVVLNTAGLAARFSGTVAVNVPGVVFSGAFTVEINNTLAAVDESIEVGGGIHTLVLPAGPFLRVTGENLQLKVAGQTLRGTFAFEQLTRSATDKVVRVGARDPRRVCADDSAALDP